MKKAIEWSVELLNLSEKQGGIDSEQCLIPTVKQIQLNAWKQGMSDARELMCQSIESIDIGLANKTL